MQTSLFPSAPQGDVVVMVYPDQQEEERTLDTIDVYMNQVDADITYEGIFLTVQDKRIVLVNDSETAIYVWQGCAATPQIYRMNDDGSRTVAGSPATCLALPEEVLVEPGTSIDVGTRMGYTIHSYNDYLVTYPYRFLPDSEESEQYIAQSEVVSGMELF